MNRRPIDISQMFIQVYTALPANERDNDNILFSNNIILPPSALQQLSELKDFDKTTNPILFRITNINLNISSHCGVSEFTAQEGTCYIPPHLFTSLLLEEGQKVTIRKANLRPGNYVKLRPHKTEFINLPNYKAILHYNLRNYFCLTENDTIPIKHGNKIFEIDIVKCRPDKGIRTLNCDLEIDFEEPKDYKVYQRKNGDKNNIMIGANIIHLEENSNTSNLSGSIIKFNSEPIPENLSEEAKKERIYEKNFIGHSFSINGKKYDENRRFRFKKKEKTSEEDNYDPRKCRLSSDQRPEFKYVELKFG